MKKKVIKKGKKNRQTDCFTRLMIKHGDNTEYQTMLNLKDSCWEECLATIT